MSYNISTIPEIEATLTTWYSFRRNLVLDRLEFKAVEEKDYKIVTKTHLNTIFRNLNWDGTLRCPLTLLETILNSNYVANYDPFVQYFKSLPKWQPTCRDYIQELADTIQTNNKEFWRSSFKKWLVATVACALKPEKINHQVLVLVGVQGIGKSTWLKNLLPERLIDYIFTGIVNPNNKDTFINLSENYFINLDELENLNKSEIGSLKALVTLNDIRVRRAYGAFNETYIRRASFMGSVNDSEFLTDMTGNRRFLCFTCDSINYKSDISINHVYAQAYYLLLNTDFKYWFTGEDISAIESQNESFIRTSVEEELLLKHFSVPAKGDQNIQLLPPSEIAVHIDKYEKITNLTNNASIRKLGQALQKHGFSKTSNKNAKPYKVVINTQADQLRKQADYHFKPSMEIMESKYW
jgi:predicted P-loop ATPase